MRTAIIYSNASFVIAFSPVISHSRDRMNTHVYISSDLAEANYQLFDELINGLWLMHIGLANFMVLA